MNHQSLLLGMLFGALLAMAAASGNSSDSMALPADNEYLHPNGIQMRFDDTELWRIHNVSDALLQTIPVAEIMEQKFGGNIWKENSKFLDISIDKEQVKAARSFLVAHRLEAELLVDNVQELIDEEQLDGVKGTQAQPGSRTSKLSS